MLELRDSSASLGFLAANRQTQIWGFAETSGAADEENGARRRKDSSFGCNDCPQMGLTISALTPQTT